VSPVGLSTQPRRKKPALPGYGWLGLLLVGAFWILNWGLSGQRTHWAFFPLWLGYCLAIDALVLKRTGTSLLTRGRRAYLALFLISAPAWWLFEAINGRTQNWIYVGIEGFGTLSYAFWTTLSFTTVMPAVFGTAELFASFAWLRGIGRGPVLGVRGRTVTLFFLTGWAMLILLLAWPRVFFPLVWLSLYFILEPVNIWLGHRSLAEWTRQGDWRPVLALWCGVLLTAFFWEMWNYYSSPKWIYEVAWGGNPKLFEMPLLGYGGYLPFSLELFAIYHFVVGLLGKKRGDYVRVSLTPAPSP
jgi:hypothetical protein